MPTEAPTTAGDQILALPVVAETCRVPLATRLGLWIAVLLFVSFALATPFLWPGEDGARTASVVALCFAPLGAWAAWMTQQQVVVDALGITWTGRGRAARHLDWNQVREVRERSTWQVLELHGLPGDPVVKVPFIVQEFARLRELVLLVAADNLRKEGRQPFELPATFRKTGQTVAGLGLAAILLVLGAAFLAHGPDHDRGPARAQRQWLIVSVGCLGGGLLVAAMTAFAWHSLTIEHDRIVLRALVRTREISMADIEAAAIETQQVTQAGLATGVHLRLTIHLLGGAQLKLGKFGETLRAHAAITWAHRQRLDGKS